MDPLMHNIKVDIAIIGGGPAGLGAACKAKKLGIKKVLILERDRELGGILQQCIHNGFGLLYFKEDLTGPEYATRFVEEAEKLRVEAKLNTMLLEITKDKRIFGLSSKEGLMQITAKAVILSMGCRERTRGALNIPGTRPAGIYTAGTAQRLVNMENLLPGKNIVVLGSGDVGLIMARRLTWVGAKVKAVVEILPYPSGLTRNIVQCLEDYNIPLILSHTVVDIHGQDRLKGVTIAKVDENRNPIKGSEKFIPCDTLLLSVGLIPENELSKSVGIELDEATGGAFVDQYMQTSIPGIFACGNVVQVYDLVDYVTESAEIAAKGANLFMKGKLKNHRTIAVDRGENVQQVVPQRFSLVKQVEPIKFYIRVQHPQEKVKVALYWGAKEIFLKKELIVKPSEMVVFEVSDEAIRKISETEKVTIGVSKYEKNT